MMKPTMKLPALFLGHGSPMNAIEESPYALVWEKLGRNLRAQYGGGIRAVLAVSAHWVTRGSAVTAMSKPRTIHDFGGFPQALFDVQYPAPGSPEVAAEIRALVGENLIAADEGWGLDHGTWGVLCHVFPEADIPVLQLSLNADLDARGHFELAQKLAVLRERGILIVASGNIVHNLRLMNWRNPESTNNPYPWAQSAQALVNGWLQTGNTAALTDDAAYPPELKLAAPSPEHLWPLLYIAAVQGEDEAVSLFNDDIVGRSLSMTSMMVGGSNIALM